MEKGLCELCNPKQWKTVSASEFTSTGYPVYGANGVIGYYNNYNHEKETLLITCRGATCGTLNICKPFSYINGNAMALDDLSDEIDIRYLYFFLLSRGLSDTITGSAQPQIVRQSLKNVRVIYPDLDAQKRIVYVLGKADELLSIRKQQLAKLDELVKSRFVEMFGDPKDNHDKLVKIGEIGDLTSGGTPSRNNPEYFNGDIRWYSAGELNSLYLPDSMEHISRVALSQSAAKLFEKGTLLIGMYDTAAFKMGILTESSSSNQACANLKPTAQYNVIWLYYLFNIMKPIFLNERQGVRQKNLSLSKIKNFNIPSAPLFLQNEFANFVERVDKQKQTVQKSLDKLELMKKALMQEYFG